jgi:hypothetical protein
MKSFFHQHDTNQEQALLHLTWHGVFNAAPTSERHTFSGIDWEYVLPSIMEQDLGGTVYKAIQRCGLKEEVSPLAFQTVKHAYFHNVFQYYKWSHILPEIFQAAQKARIRMLLLRGIHLTEVFYKDPGLRSSVDADLLVHEPDLARIATLLAGLGFRQHRIYRNLYFRDNCCLDLHTHPLNERRKRVRHLVYPLHFDDIWQDRTSFTLGTTSINASSIYDELLLSALHSIKHAFSHLKWSLDMAAIIHRTDSPINWNQLAQRAADSNLQHGLWLALSIASTLWPNALPAEICGRLHTGSTSPCSHPTLQRDLVNFQPDLYFLHHVNGIGNKMRWAVAALFPEKDVRHEIMFAEGYKGFPEYFLARLRTAWTALSSLRS